MLNIEQVRSIILENIRPMNPETTPASSTLLGAILAEDIHADMDSPPFDKSTMDGFAVRLADLETHPKGMPIGTEIPTRGMDPITLPRGMACPIMTGAQIPRGADLVIPKEEAILEHNQVQFTYKSREAGTNIFARGREFARGEILLRKGTRLNPQRMAILAACGKTSVMAYPSPRVSIISTGTELVEPNMTPHPGQIRNTNAPLLVASCSIYKALPKYLGIAGDSASQISTLLEEAVSANAVIICGGMSAGKYDLVPDVLRTIGVNIFIHKVNLKPGKPFLFGMTKTGVPVFGLPGNPASVFACFHLFVRPALDLLRGKQPSFILAKATLTHGFQHQSDRTTCHPVSLASTNGTLMATPEKWQGSADLLGLSRADGLMILPEGSLTLMLGDSVSVIKTNHPASS